MKKKKIKLPKERNWCAVAAHFKTGAGSHKSKKTYTRKIKHKGSKNEY
jgi:predicted component of type VI protein secretion system